MVVPLSNTAVLTLLFWNAEEALVTEAGILMLVIFVLAIKLLPNEVMLEGIVSEVIPEHPENALELIVVNELGRVILVNPVHP